MKQLEPYVAFYKVASYELLWTDLLKACAATGKPVIISTGMAIMPEIKAAVATLEAGGRQRHHGPALRLGLSFAAGAVEPVGHRRHPQGDRRQDRLVGSFARRPR